MSPDPYSFYYTRDHLDSIREVTGTNGLVLARYDYDPYGVQTQVSGSMMVDIGYAGYYLHQPSGLLMPVNREYLPSIGCWTSKDPLGEAGGINLYGYVANNPVLHVDPLGLEIRLYSAPGFNNSYLSHEFFYSTDENQGLGEYGSTGSGSGDGVPDGFDPNNTSDPYVTLDTNGLTDSEFLDLVQESDYANLNGGFYLPYAHDCHDAAQRGYKAATGNDLPDPFPRVSSWRGAIGSLIGGLLDDPDPEGDY